MYLHRKTKEQRNSELKHSMFGPRLQLLYFRRNIYKIIYNCGLENKHVRKKYKEHLSKDKIHRVKQIIFKTTAGTLTTSRAVITIRIICLFQNVHIFKRLLCFQVSREFGFVVSSAGDWSLDLCTYPMSVMVREMNRIWNESLIILSLKGLKLYQFYAKDY